MLLDDDRENGRHWAMWQECGIQFRSNLLDAIGGCIPLHVHSYDHIALITHGVFKCSTIAPDGSQDAFIVASKDFDIPDSSGYRLVIPAGYQHTFVLVDARGQPGEVLCFWPDGGDR